MMLEAAVRFWVTRSGNHELLGDLVQVHRQAVNGIGGITDQLDQLAFDRLENGWIYLPGYHPSTAFR